MLHLGDITKIHGGEAPVVDVVIGGSPCQDLSIAGKRAGLAGARSGLYMEQIRIVKEMRERDMASGRTGEFVRPRYMVWENVPGAFSSNGGKDFAAVLEEAIRIAEPEAPDIEVPEKGWNTWGGYHDEVGGRWSVAWRVLDAQHWGVPQRRRRIALVADFGGDTAWEVLFERKSVSGHPAESGAAGADPAVGAESGAGYAIPINDKATRCTGGGPTRNHDGAGNGLGIGKDGDPSPTLTAGDRHAVCAGPDCLTPWDCQSKRIFGTDGKAPTLQGGVGGGVNNPAMLCAVLDMSHACDVIRDCGEVAPSLQARMETGGNQIPLTYQKTTGTLSPGAHAGSYNGQDAYNDMLVVSSEISPALRAKANDPYRTDMAAYVASVDCRNFTEGGEINGTLQAKESGGQSLNLNNTVRQNMVVRRLTPLECERLQGFPDGWTDIGDWVKTDKRGRKIKVKGSADSPRYKALGNSIALPPWKWLLKRLCGNYERDATMASLFDGIGGFPLIWEQLNGYGTCLWASEIEEFPIAVTKRRFGTLEESGDMGRFLFPCGKDEL